MSLVRDEIAEQPAAVERVLADADGAIAAAAEEIRRRQPRYAVIAARGSSDNAARYAQHVLGRLCGLPVALATPSLHTVYDAPMRYTDGLVIGISQSGASPDVVAVLAAARAQGCVTVAITNDPASPMATAATHVIALHAGAEESVAATKTYTTSLAAAAALAAGVAGDAGKTRELAGVPDALEPPARAPRRNRRRGRRGRGVDAARRDRPRRQLLRPRSRRRSRSRSWPAWPPSPRRRPTSCTGRSRCSTPASPCWRSRRPAGPRSTTCSPRRASATPTITVIGDDGLAVEPVPEWLSPLCAVVPAQLLAVGAAERRGLDVDRPIGLQKVTRTT